MFVCITTTHHTNPSRFLIWLLAFLTEFVDLWPLCCIREHPPPKSNDPRTTTHTFFFLYVFLFLSLVLQPHVQLRVWFRKLCLLIPSCFSPCFGMWHPPRGVTTRLHPGFSYSFFFIYLMSLFHLCTSRCNLYTRHMFSFPFSSCSYGCCFGSMMSNIRCQTPNTPRLQCFFFCCSPIYVVFFVRSSGICLSTHHSLFLCNK